MPLPTSPGCHLAGISRRLLAAGLDGDEARSAEMALAPSDSEG